MYAVISTGGKQYKVSEGDFLRIEKINENVGDKVVFDKVLLLKSDDALICDSVGLEDKNVEAKVVAQDKAKKVVVGKYKKRKNYRRKIGHRQPYTGIIISKINV